MKKLTCRDLGGPCDAEITGNSFEEVGKKSHDHVMEQISHGDDAHRAAAEKLRNAPSEEQKAMMASSKRSTRKLPRSKNLLCARQLTPAQARRREKQAARRKAMRFQCIGTQSRNHRQGCRWHFNRHTFARSASCGQCRRRGSLLLSRGPLVRVCIR